jgi:hypothetical protein
MQMGFGGCLFAHLVISPCVDAIVFGSTIGSP